MAEATHTSEAIYGLKSGIGRGAKIYAAYAAISDAETLDTGLDTIEGIATIEADADIDADSPLVLVKSISGGTITWVTGAIGAYANVGDAPCYLVVVGSVR